MGDSGTDAPTPLPASRTCPRCGASYVGDICPTCPGTKDTDSRLEPAGGRLPGSVLHSPSSRRRRSGRPFTRLRSGTRANLESMRAQPADRLHHFSIEKNPDGSLHELGRGGMGVTYKAFDERLRLLVALKVIVPFREHDTAAQALFLREARAAARVRHSNVASVLYLNDAPGNFFYAMEFVDGVSLEAWLKSQGPVDPFLAVSIGEQITRGLAAIHDQGIIHRDLKPSNIMLVGDSSRPRTAPVANRVPMAKIIDFGLARPIARSETETQSIGFRGTALYASPEQCEEQTALDGRSDLYSLGCILFQMLTGKPPFAAKSHRELMNLHVSAPVPLERLALAPPALQRVVICLLAKRPEERPESAAAVIAELEHCRVELSPRRTAAPQTTPSLGGSSKSWIPSSTTSALRAAVDPITLRFPEITTTTPIEESLPRPATTPVPVATPSLEPAAPPARRAAPELIPMPALPELVRPVPAPRAPRVTRRGVIIAAAGIFVLGLTLGILPQLRPTSPEAEEKPLPKARVTAATAPVPVPLLPTNPPQAPRKAVAVLPFANLTGGQETAYFAEGMHEDILTSLAKVRDLRVISRSSVLGFKPDGERNLKKIAATLGVSAIVEGTVRRAENKIRVTTQLIDAETGDNLWAEAFDREITDFIAIQSQIALAIAGALKANLSPGEKTALAEPANASSNAYELFAKARSAVKNVRNPREGLATAEKLLEEAIQVDPSFARAYAQLSVVHMLRYAWGSDRTDDRLAKAYAAAHRAVQAGGDFADGQVALGTYFFRGVGDRSRALGHFQKALASEPQNADALAAIANIQRRLGRWEESVVSYAAAVRLNPLDQNLQYNYANTLRLMRRFDEAAIALAEATAKMGDNLLFGFVRSDLFLAWKGDLSPWRSANAALTQLREGHEEIRVMREVQLLLFEKKYAEARQTLEQSKFNLLDGQHLFLSRNALAAEIEQQAGEREKARQLWQKVVEDLAPLVGARSDPRLAIALATAKAGAGDFEAARQEADRAAQDPKVADDQFDAVFYLQRRALVYLRSGRPGEARAMIEELLRRPGDFSREFLRLAPEWQSLPAQP